MIQLIYNGKVKSFIITLFILFCPIPTNAQEANIKSADILEEEVLTQIEQFKLDSALFLINKSIPKLDNLPDYHSRFMRYKGICYDYLRVDDSVTYYLNLSLNYPLAQKNYDQISKIYIDFGKFFHRRELLDNATFYYILSLGAFENSPNSNYEIMASVENNIGLIKYRQEDYNVSKSYYLDAISHYKKMEDTQRSNVKIINTYLNMITCLNQLEEYDEGLMYCDKIFQYAEENDDNLTYGLGLSQKSTILYETEDYRGSIDNSLLGYKLVTETDETYVGPLLYNLVIGYREMEMYDSSLYYNQIGLEISKKMDNLRYVLSFHENFQVTYEELGNYEMAFNPSMNKWWLSTITISIVFFS